MKLNTLLKQHTVPETKKPLFTYVNSDDVQAFKQTYLNVSGEIPFSDKVAFLAGTGEVFTHGQLFGSNEVYIGDPQNAPANAKIIIDTTEDETIEVYTKEQSDLKFYNKTEIDNNIYNKSQTDEKFYNKTEADELYNSKQSCITAIANPDFTAGVLQPNTYYAWGVVDSLDLTLEPATSTVVKEYCFQFTSPENAPTALTLPGNLKWYSNPVVRKGRTYQCSIINNLAILGEFV